MERRIAVIGDIHGCHMELSQLLQELHSEGVTEIYHLGDLVDRGPDSGKVLELVLQHGIKGVMGNHESRLLDIRRHRGGIKNPDKKRSSLALDQTPGAWEYLESLPRVHVIDDFLSESLILVHGGLWPYIPLYAQPFAVLMAQLVDPDKPGAVAWLNNQKAKEQGYAPWWEIYDGQEYVCFGHTVFDKVQIHGRTIGLDTGCVFGGALTALILPDFRYIQVKARETYAKRDSYL